MSSRTLSLAAAALLVAARAGAQQSRDFTPYMMPDRAAEIALARSAALASVSDSARVLVLTRTGYVEAVPGSNGFTCAVFRSYDGPVTNPEFWNPRIRSPQCFNPPAARTVLPEQLKNTEWVLAGATPAELPARVKSAYASHQFEPPAPGSLVFMLSPQQYLLDASPRLSPHLMFFYDKSLPPSAWGAVSPTARVDPVIDGSIVNGNSEVQLIIVPVRWWSDGTLVVPSSAGHAH